MPTSVPLWWTEENIIATVNEQFVLDRVKPEERELLHRSLSFGAGLTDDTYLDWILTRARRFFLILVDIGISDQIFGIVDESYDDEDLPVAADAVRQLRLSYQPDPTLDKRFWKAQFLYLVKKINEGDHVQYEKDNIVPVEVVGSRAGSGTTVKDSTTDNVHLHGVISTMYTRRRIPLDESPQYLTEEEVLAEVTAIKKLTHEHVISVYGSYSYENNIHVLLMPAIEYTLKSFMHDPPSQFKNLPKPLRRETIVNWPHCLSDGLAWLHEKGRHHGALRPSNIYIDSTYRIFLGHFDSYKIIQPNTKVNDIEAYQYAAPERWKRSPIMQSTAPVRTALHSGGRTARKHAESISESPSAAARRPSWTSDVLTLPDTTQPTNTASPFTIDVEKFRSGKSAKGEHYEESITSSNSSGTKSGSLRIRNPSQSTSGRAYQVPSLNSSSSSGSGKTVHPLTTLPNAVAVPAPEVRAAIVQTWQSTQSDPFPSDIFALAAVTLDILSLLCKRSMSSFARHRSAKNRTAGRGGGLADASFHANLGQVTSWMSSLDHDAFKKDDKVFRSIPPTLAVVKDMLEKDPSLRPTADVVERRFEDAIWRHAGLADVHCQSAKAKHRPPSYGPELGARMPVFEEAQSLIESPLESMYAEWPLSGNPDPMGSDQSRSAASQRDSSGSNRPIHAESSSSSLDALNFDYTQIHEFIDETEEQELGDRVGSTNAQTKDGVLHMRPWSKDLSLTASQDSFLVPGDIFPPRNSSMSTSNTGSSDSTIRPEARHRGQSGGSGSGSDGSNPGEPVQGLDHTMQRPLHTQNFSRIKDVAHGLFLSRRGRQSVE